MSETLGGTTYVFPENNGGGNGAVCSGIMSMLGAMAQKQGMDPATLMAMMNNGGFGGNNFMWVIFLFFLMGNGWGGFNRDGNGLNTDADTMRLANLINNNDGNARVMAALEGNSASIQSLSQQLGCSTSQVTAALNSVSGMVQNVSNQVGMSSQQVINAVQSGDAGIISQIQSCCCNLGQKIQEQGYQSQLAMCQQTGQLMTTINDGVRSIKDGDDLRHRETLARLDAMEKSAMQSKIDALQEAKSTLQTQLNLEHQTAQLQAYQAQSLIPLQQGLASLQQQVNAVRAAQPPVATVPYSPVVGVPASVAYQAGLTGAGANGGAFWY